MPKAQPKHPMDIALGQRIRFVRDQAGISRGQLASECGVSWQQIEKYEQAKSRVSFSRLTEIAKALDMPVTQLIAPLLDEKYREIRSTGYIAWLQIDGAMKMLESYSSLNTDQRRALLNVVRSFDNDS